MREFLKGSSLIKVKRKTKQQGEILVWKGELRYKDEDGTVHKIQKVLRDKDKKYVRAYPHTPNGTKRGKQNNKNIETAQELLEEWRKSEEQADREAAETEASLSAQHQDVTVSDFLEQFITTLALSGTVAPSTIKGYRGSAKYASAAFGDAPVSSVTRDMVQAMINNMNKDGRKPSTVHKAVVLLSMAMDDAIEGGLLVKNPCRKVKRPKMGKSSRKQPNCLDKASRARFVEYVRTHKATYTVVAAALGAFGGLRVGECCALRWNDVDLEGGLISVRASIGHGQDASGNGIVYVNEGGKTADAVRELPIIPQLRDVLERRRAEVKAQADALKIAFDPEWFVLSNAGAPFMNPIGVSRSWKVLADAEGFTGIKSPTVPFHDLRHGFISVAVAGGADVVSVVDAVGHADASMTLDTYAAPLDEGKRKMARIVAQAYGE